MAQSPSSYRYRRQHLDVGGRVVRLADERDGVDERQGLDLEQHRSELVEVGLAELRLDLGLLLHEEAQRVALPPSLPLNEFDSGN